MQEAIPHAVEVFHRLRRRQYCRPGAVRSKGSLYFPGGREVRVCGYAQCFMSRQRQRLPQRLPGQHGVIQGDAQKCSTQSTVPKTFNQCPGTGMATKDIISQFSIENRRGVQLTSKRNVPCFYVGCGEVQHRPGGAVTVKETT